MSAVKSTSFLDRLAVIAAGRKLTPWLLAIGWTTGDVDRVKTKGHIPGPAKLALLVHAEGVNLSWLLTGLGPPRFETKNLKEQAAHYNVKLTPAQQLMDLLPELPEDAVKALLKTAQLMKPAAPR